MRLHQRNLKSPVIVRPTPPCKVVDVLHVCCMFVLFAAKVIKLSVVRLLLEASSDCSKDCVAIYDGWTVDGGASIARLCGADLPAQPYVTDSNIAVVSFTSDETGTDAGFSIEYQPQATGEDLSGSASDHNKSKFSVIFQFARCR